MKQSIYEHFPKLGRRFNRLGLKPKVIENFLLFPQLLQLFIIVHVY